MKIGAFDFVQKPFEIEEMKLKIEKAIEFRDLKYQVEYLRHEQRDLQIGEHSASSAGSERAPVVTVPPTGIPLEEIERQAVIEALRMSNWVQKDAAGLLGISPRLLTTRSRFSGSSSREAAGSSRRRRFHRPRCGRSPVD